MNTPISFATPLQVDYRVLIRPVSLFVRRGVWSARHAGEVLCRADCPLDVAVQVVGRAAALRGGAQ